MTAIPAAVLKSHIAIVGKTGSGKTSTEKLAVEQVVADGARVCVLDTVKSDWWGITSSASGKSAGLPFKILGGPRGHVPLHSSAGKVIGQLVASGKLPLSIIDMADFEAGGVQRFFVDFAQALFRNMRGVLYLVIEEAHEVAPKERAGFGAENLSIHWAKKMATAGRSKGIRLIVATQRVQSLHNAILGSCETLIAHRLTTPADQEPIRKWLQANAPSKEDAAGIAAAIARLATGSGWLCSGEAQIFQEVKFPKFKTFDNSKTPEGNEASADVTVAHVDQDELRSLIGDAVKQAEADDPKILRQRIAQLEREVKQGIPAQAIVDAERDAREKIAPAEFAKGFAAALYGAEQIYARGASAFIQLDRAHQTMQEALRTVDGVMQDFKTWKNSAIATDQWKSGEAKPTRKPPVVTVGDVRDAKQREERKLPQGEERMLICIAQHNQTGVTREQLTAFTGYKRSTRNVYLQRLFALHVLYERADRIHVNAEATCYLPSGYEPLPTGQALQRFWLDRLPEGERKVLEACIEAYPNGLTRDDLDDKTGYKRSTRNVYIQRLVSKMLLTASAGYVAASEDLF